MSKGIFSSAFPFLAYWVKRLGWSSVIGFTLVCISLVVYVAFLRPMEQRLQVFNQDVLASSTVQDRSAWKLRSPQVKYLSFYQTLSSEKSIPDLLEKIFDAAQKSDLFLDQGQFKKLKAPDDVSFIQYQVELPVIGSYADVRKFVNRVLKEIPAAALSEISFIREDVKAADAEAKVLFTVYLKATE